MTEKDNLIHEKYIRRCLELAALGNSYVAPNPMVGAILVYKDRIIGEGYHQKYGEAHAEVNCINAVKEYDKQYISKSTLYVSLEPCSHFGKTPPCTHLILQHKIPKVVICIQDKFEAVNGKGIQLLKQHNIEVITGVLETEGKELLKHFLFFHQYKQPYVTLKFAQSKDHFMGIKNQNVKISNVLSQQYVHKLRAKHQSILIGKNTALTDNPYLTVRDWNGKNPTRIIIGNKKDFNSEYNILNDEAETIFISNSPKMELKDILREIYHKNILSVLVEGGASILNQFIKSNLWNEAHIITSDKNMHEIDKNNLAHLYIKSPIITAELTENRILENDNIQLLNNKNALFIA